MDNVKTQIQPDINIATHLDNFPLVATTQHTKTISVIVSRKTSCLSGEVNISGSKNIGLKLLTIAPLFKKPITLIGVPRNNQVKYLISLLQSFGSEVNIDHNSTDGYNLTIYSQDIVRNKFNYEEIGYCRHVFLMAMSILMRTGEVTVPLPGYSHYGHRPIDGQLNGLKKMGANVSKVDNGNILITIPKDGLKGAKIFLPFPSNAVSEALIWAGVAAKGRTTLHGVAQEPETIEIIKFFKKAGVTINGIGTPTIEIYGSGLDDLATPSNFVIAPDRIETGSLCAALAICTGEIKLNNIRNDFLGAIRATLQNMGVNITEKGDNSWLLSCDDRPNATEIRTHPFPGFPTDAQGPFLAAMSIAKGNSILHEALWSNRLSLAMELKRMGANIKVLNGNLALVEGAESLTGTKVLGTDPRATAALIMAGLFANGETTTGGIDLLDNAYDSFDGKLKQLCAKLERKEVEFNLFSRHHPIYGKLEAF